MMSEPRLVRQRIAAQSAMSLVVAAWAQAPVRTPIQVFFGVNPLRSSQRVDYRTAIAELEVGDVLERLGQRWDVLHDLPLREGSIDHLVIGPAGVFAVRTVHCGGLDAVLDGSGLSIGAELRDDVALARAAADEVSDLLGDALGERPRVRALLVLVEARRRVSPRLPGTTVRVVPLSDLDRMLTRAPRTLTGEQVAAVSDIADRGSTWPNADPAAFDPRALHREFGAIRSEVRRALARRALWMCAGAAVCCGIVWGIVASMVAIAVLI